MAKISCW